MAKVTDVVKAATSELNALVRDIKQSDEDDLAQLAELFDKVSARADAAAQLLAAADQALNGGGSADDEQQPGEGSS